LLKPHPVDHPPILGEAEQARAGIAGLRQRRQRPHLDEAEAEAEHLAEDLRILVEARGQADRVGKGEAGKLDGRGPDRARRPAGGKQLQRRDRGAVGALGVEREGEGAKEGVERHGSVLSVMRT
jgi:hypothetical protein